MGKIKMVENMTPVATNNENGSNEVEISQPIRDAIRDAKRKSAGAEVYTSLELCAGMGGQALGLERAGFEHIALVEIEELFCETLRLNRPKWNVIAGDLKLFSGTHFNGVIDLLAGGVPCPPFSVAGKQLGANDERDLFPDALRIARECDAKAIMLENVKGLLGPKFTPYRENLDKELRAMGYVPFWKLHQASDHGVAQLRPRVTLVALKPQYAKHFKWPETNKKKAPTVGQLLKKEMGARGWKGADAWAKGANGVGPTLVGGSTKHGGADLGPTRAKQGWAALGVNAHTLAEEAPDPGFVGMPRLTVKMAAMVQGFPATWKIAGKKTKAYRQVGNAFPPPVAAAIGRSIKAALAAGDKDTTKITVEEAEALMAAAEVAEQEEAAMLTSMNKSRS